MTSKSKALSVVKKMDKKDMFISGKQSGYDKSGKYIRVVKGRTNTNFNDRSSTEHY